MPYCCGEVSDVSSVVMPCPLRRFWRSNSTFVVARSRNSNLPASLSITKTDKAYPTRTAPRLTSPRPPLIRHSLYPWGGYGLLDLMVCMPRTSKAHQYNSTTTTSVCRSRRPRCSLTRSQIGYIILAIPYNPTQKRPRSWTQRCRANDDR